MDDLKQTCSLNYEAEYERLHYKLEEIQKKLADTEEKANYLYEENMRYKTIVKTMEFILGRKFDG